MTAAFHAYVLYALYRGVPALKQLRALESTVQAMAASPATKIG